MNDKLCLENYLLILKSTVEVYVHGTLESSNSDTRDLLNDSLNETLASQANTYNKMVDEGWYEKEEVSIDTISNTLNNLKNEN